MQGLVLAKFGEGNPGIDAYRFLKDKSTWLIILVHHWIITLCPDLQKG
jgi:hypothetical protein